MNGPENENASTKEPHSQAVDLASESVAGEEDPGAALDMPESAFHLQASGGSGCTQPFTLSDAIDPGDDAPVLARNTGESVCCECGGAGTITGALCLVCGGTGRVNTRSGGG